MAAWESERQKAHHAFAAPIRYSGLSFSHNVGYALSGGLTPVAVPLLLAINPPAHAYYVIGLCALECGIGLWLLRNDSLRAIDAVSA